MALQWDALATGDVRVMMAAQNELARKPYGTTWITYTRCHDDIGLGYDDAMIAAAGFHPPAHRDFLKGYYTGVQAGSPARGALFGVNPKTNDARISGTLASLCGLESALEQDSDQGIEEAIQKIALMQAHSLLLGGIPMLFYGDECGYINDTAYLSDPSKSYDNRWMHRPQINWKKNNLIHQEGTIENKIYNTTKKLIALRKEYPVFSDLSNLDWLAVHNTHIAGFRRFNDQESVICLFNFSANRTGLTWYAIKEKGWPESNNIKDVWSKQEWTIGSDHEHLMLDPYQFVILKQF
jgi:amylosucrase